MSTVAILPAKAFAEAKQRLCESLSPGGRRALAEAMFHDVLIALRRTRAIDAVLVVSGDPVAQQIAGGHGADVLNEADPGHNAAARTGIERALRIGAERVLLVPGDCPMLEPAELDTLLARSMAERSALIVPDRHGTGTNALLLRPPDALEPAFGPDSLERHLESARADGVQADVVHVSSLALDVDTDDDFEALQLELQKRRGGAANTRGMLVQLLRTRSA